MTPEHPKDALQARIFTDEAKGHLLVVLAVRRAVHLEVIRKARGDESKADAYRGRIDEIDDLVAHLEAAPWRGQAIASDEWRKGRTNDY